jgi:hypothetical protein
MSMDYSQPTPSEQGYYQRAYTTRTTSEAPDGFYKNVVRVGGARALFNPDDVWAIEEDTMSQCVQLALNRKLALTANGLVVRELLPDLDFRDQNNGHIDKREWRQPWSGSYSASGNVAVYQTNSIVENHKKVYGFYGARLTDAGPGRTGTNLNAACIVFKDASNPRDIISLEGIDATQESLIIFRQPLIYQDSQVVKVDMYPKSAASGTYDSIQLLGCLVETVGSTIVGS